MNRLFRQIATSQYRRSQLRRRLIAFSAIALLSASLIATHAGAFGRCGDDWSRFDHRSFRVTGVDSDESIQIVRPGGEVETVKLLGIAAASSAGRTWLSDRAMGREATILLQSPQTRDSSGRMLAFVFIDHSDLSVELAKAGLVYADRRERTVMDGLIDPAEAEARKKKRGIWADLKFDQMPEWRKAWMRSLPGYARH